EIRRALVKTDSTKWPKTRPWQLLTEHFNYSCNEIEADLVGGSMAKEDDKARYIVERLSRNGTTLSKLHAAFIECGLDGALAACREILPPPDYAAAPHPPTEE